MLPVSVSGLLRELLAYALHTACCCDGTRIPLSALLV